MLPQEGILSSLVDQSSPYLGNSIYTNSTRGSTNPRYGPGNQMLVKNPLKLCSPNVDSACDSKKHEIQ